MVCYFKPEDEKLHAGREDMHRQFAELRDRFLGRKYQTERGHEYGLSRRLDTMVRAVDVVFEKLPPELDEIPERDTVVDATLTIQAFAMNAFGCLDNLAWIWSARRRSSTPRARSSSLSECASARKARKSALPLARSSSPIRQASRLDRQAFQRVPRQPRSPDTPIHPALHRHARDSRQVQRTREGEWRCHPEAGLRALRQAAGGAQGPGYLATMDDPLGDGEVPPRRVPRSASAVAAGDAAAGACAGSAGARSRARAHQDRISVGAGARRPAMGRQRSPCVVFHYAPGRGGIHADTILDGFNGVLQVDGYGGYHRLARPKRSGGDPPVLAHCRVHARREVIKATPKKGSPMADEILRRIASLYAIEKESRGRMPELRCQVRQERSRPIADELKSWIRDQHARLSSKSPIGTALAYIANHWHGLCVFLEDGRVKMDTNPVENLIRPLTLNRKNALFCGHDEGGVSWARIASLVETCKLNRVNPYDWLRTTLEALAQEHPSSRLNELLPWNFRPQGG